MQKLYDVDVLEICLYVNIYNFAKKKKKILNALGRWT